MPRQKPTRPTKIYWLVDMRPEMIAAGWPNGLPFYCGKTDRAINARLYEHKRDAVRHPYGLVGPRLALCGDNVRIQAMEVVPVGGPWHERERRWIWVLEAHFPDTCNVSKGGDGASGVVRSAEFRANASARRKGIPLSPETRAKLSAANKGKKASKETREKLAANTKARWESDEYRAKMTAVSNATWADTAKREEIVAGHKKRWENPEYRATVTLRSKAGKTDAHFIQHSEMMRAKWATDEHREKVAAGKARRAEATHV